MSLLYVRKLISSDPVHHVLLLVTLGAQADLVLSDCHRLAILVRQMFSEQSIVLLAAGAVIQGGVQSLGVTLGDLNRVPNHPNGI